MGILVRLSSSIWVYWSDSVQVYGYIGQAQFKYMGILVRLSSSIWVFWSDSVQVYGYIGQTQFKYMGILVRLSSDRYIYTYYILELHESDRTLYV